MKILTSEQMKNIDRWSRRRLGGRRGGVPPPVRRDASRPAGEDAGATAELVREWELR